MTSTTLMFALLILPGSSLEASDETSPTTMTVGPHWVQIGTADPNNAPVVPAAPAGGSDFFFAGGEIVSSPKPVNLNLDGDDRPGIAFGTSLGDAYVLTADGAVAPGWPRALGSQVGYCSPAVADLTGNGADEIVFHANNELHVRAVDGSSPSGWPRTLDSNIVGNSMIGSPVIADLDGNGDLEIVVGHLQRMYAFHHDGTLMSGWPVLQPILFGPLFSTPAVGDLDGDGDLEICFKIYGGNGDPADIRVMHHDGSSVAGWPKLGLDRSHLSSPVLADVDGDGALDVIVSLHFFDGGNYVRVYVWNADGSDVAGFPVAGNWNTAPENNAVGDVDGDGALEIFVSTSNGTSPHYAVHAWNHDGSVLAGSWPRSASLCLANSSPIVADLNGGGNEVLVGTGGCFVNDTGVMNAWSMSGTPVTTGWPQATTGYLRSSVLVMDADDDGTPEVYTGSSDGWIHRFLAADTSGGMPPEWNQIFHELRNTNCYRLALPADLDGDGLVGFADLLVLLANWGPCGEPCPPGCLGDLDDDCEVGFSDLLVLLGSWS